MTFFSTIYYKMTRVNTKLLSKDYTIKKNTKLSVRSNRTNLILYEFEMNELEPRTVMDPHGQSPIVTVLLPNDLIGFQNPGA